MRFRNTNAGALLLAQLLMLVAPNCAGSQDGSPKVSKSDANTLVQIGIKAYEANSEFLTKFHSALSHVTREAGEGLHEDLFSDPISMLESVLRLDPDNMKAHLYLGKSFSMKAYRGEGEWNKELATKAKEHFATVISLSEKKRVDKRVVEEAQSQLRELERILKEGY